MKLAFEISILRTCIPVPLCRPALCISLSRSLPSFTCNAYIFINMKRK